MLPNIRTLLIRCGNKRNGPLAGRYDALLGTSKHLYFSCHTGRWTSSQKTSSSSPAASRSIVSQSETPPIDPALDISSVKSKLLSSKNLDRDKLSSSDQNDQNVILLYRSLPERLVAKLPKPAQPYAQLMRLDKPTGLFLLLIPVYWSIGMAIPAGQLPGLDLITVGALCTTGGILMRGAGCTINDMWDHKLDAAVERTKNRPIASGALSLVDALFFLAGQLGLAALILLQFDTNSILLGASSIGLISTYPAMKRITHWPQLFLGLTFNWGALLGYSLATGGAGLDLPVVLPLYAASVFWTLIYDTIYAHQDRRDDLLVGVKSTAIHFGADTAKWLSGFSVGMVSCLALVGVNQGFAWPYYASVAYTAGLLARQIATLNIDDPADCWKKFKQNAQLGPVIGAGILLANLLR